MPFFTSNACAVVPLLQSLAPLHSRSLRSTRAAVAPQRGLVATSAPLHHARLRSPHGVASRHWLLEPITSRRGFIKAALTRGSRHGIESAIQPSFLVFVWSFVLFLWPTSANHSMYALIPHHRVISSVQIDGEWGRWGSSDMRAGSRSICWLLLRDPLPNDLVARASATTLCSASMIAWQKKSATIYSWCDETACLQYIFCLDPIQVWAERNHFLFG